MVSIVGGAFAFLIAGQNAHVAEPTEDEEQRIGAALHDGIISLPSSPFILWLARIAPWSKLIKETRRYLGRVFRSAREARAFRAAQMRAMASEPSFNEMRGREAPNAPEPVDVGHA